MKKLGFGCMRLPLLNKDDQTSIDVKQVEKMFDLFLSRGFTYFDTAYMYHEYKSESIVKEALVNRHPRDSFTIASKLPSMFLKTPEDQVRIFDEQLNKVGVSYFDYYLLHNLNSRTYPTVCKFNSVDFLLKKKEEGKIKHMGFSFHDTPEYLDKILTEHPEIEFVQLQINYLDWDNPNVQSRRCYEVALKHHKKVVVMEPVKGGTLADIPMKGKEEFMKISSASPSSFAIRFAASLDDVMVVLSGMSTLGQVEDNTSYMENFLPLTEKEYKAIDKVRDIIHSNIAVNCTGCRYCVDGCPKKILIPDLFKLYNKEKQYMSKGLRDEYNRLILTSGKAKDCISCRQCERTCPQHLPVSDLMKKVSASFDR